MNQALKCTYFEGPMEYNNTDRKRRATNLPVDMAGKIQPQARELEESVLGALMLEREKVDLVIDILSTDHFYVEQHRLVFEAIRDLYSDAQPIDILTVTNKLRSTGKLDLVGGPYFIAQLTSRVASAANIVFHSRILTEKFIQRQLISVTGMISSQAYEEGRDAFELLDSAEKELYEIKNKSLKQSYQPINSLLHKAFAVLEEKKTSESGHIGVPSGIEALDRITSGWQKSDLVILAARPGMGKTAMALTVARNAAVDHNKPVAVFSLEMSDVQLVTRLIASETGINNEKLKRADLEEHEWQQLMSKTSKLGAAKLYIDDTPQLSIFDLKAKCRRLHSQHQIELVVIDYLQLMRADEKNVNNREQEISHISRSLKGLAKELNIPIIALAQLSREVEKRSDKQPQLSDLRESGSIEQDADMVIFIYRDEYYGNNQDESGNSNEGMAELIIAKHRNGSTAKVPMRYIKEFAKFVDVESSEHFASSSENNEMFQRVTYQSKMNEHDEEDDGFDTPSFITEE